MTVYEAAKKNYQQLRKRFPEDMRQSEVYWLNTCQSQFIQGWMERGFAMRDESEGKENELELLKKDAERWRWVIDNMKICGFEIERADFTNAVDRAIESGGPLKMGEK